MNQLALETTNTELIQTSPKLTHTNKTFDANVTLWEFLLELLLDENSMNLISWTNYEGEFRLHQSEEVARLWGLRKKRNNMNYDKLSRALRYYYDKNIIQKVAGKKFVYQFVTFPDTFSKSQIKLPPADFLKRMNSLSMGSLSSGPTGPSLTTMGGPPTGQLALTSNTGHRRHPLSKPDFSLPTPKTTVTSLGVPEIQKLTGPNPTSHNINLANQIRSSEASRKRSRNHEINLISYQKEQDEITLQLKLLDMYNELLQNPAFSNSEVPLTFPQFVALTQSLTYQANQGNQSATVTEVNDDLDSHAGSVTSSPLSTSSSSSTTSALVTALRSNDDDSSDLPLDLTTKKFKLEPVDL